MLNNFISGVNGNVSVSLKDIVSTLNLPKINGPTSLDSFSVPQVATETIDLSEFLSDVNVKNVSGDLNLNDNAMNVGRNLNIGVENVNGTLNAYSNDSFNTNSQNNNIQISEVKDTLDLSNQNFNQPTNRIDYENTNSSNLNINQSSGFGETNLDLPDVEEIKNLNI